MASKTTYSTVSQHNKRNNRANQREQPGECTRICCYSDKCPRKCFEWWCCVGFTGLIFSIMLIVVRLVPYMNAHDKYVPTTCILHSAKFTHEDQECSFEKCESSGKQQICKDIE